MHLEMGNVDVARQIFEHAIKAAPGSCRSPQIDWATGLRKRRPASVARDFLLLRPSLLSFADHIDVIESFGSFLAETGELETARELLLRSVTLAPDRGHAKYMYLSQLLEGQEAIEHAKHGVRILESALASSSDPNDLETDLEETSALLTGTRTRTARIPLATRQDT